jgi:hypothetical protein
MSSSSVKCNRDYTFTKRPLISAQYASLHLLRWMLPEMESMKSCLDLTCCILPEPIFLLNSAFQVRISIFNLSHALWPNWYWIATYKVDLVEWPICMAHMSPLFLIEIDINILMFTWMLSGHSWYPCKNIIFAISFRK